MGNGIKYQCTSCDIEAQTRNDPKFEHCASNSHEILKFNDPNSVEGKRSTSTKVKGFVSNYFVESVIISGKPKFLARNVDNDDITVKGTIEEFRPLKAGECGYYPYTFEADEITDIKKIKTEEVMEEVKEQVNRYIIHKDLDKNLILGDILLTYCQENIKTIHFPFFVGETESGKSSVLHLGKWLNYRCLYGEDIPNADIYNFLGSDEEGTGTICEDEAQELFRDREKIRTYKNSYSKGSVKARIVQTDKKKSQIYYKTFCPKWFAGERIPQDKGFLERLAIINMMEGIPTSNIKRITKDEELKLNKLRNKLLIWKLQNIGVEPLKVDIDLMGRDEELWQDFANIATGTKFQVKFESVVSYYIKQRHEAIRNSIEARIFKLVIDKINERFEINFLEFWDYFTDNNDLTGNLDDKSKKTFYPDEFSNKITHHFLSKILEYKFQGTKSKQKHRKEGIQHQVTIYSFPKEHLQALVRKYGIVVPIDNPLNVGEQGEHGNQVDQADQVTEV